MPSLSLGRLTCHRVTRYFICWGELVTHRGILCLWKFYTFSNTFWSILLKFESFNYTYNLKKVGVSAAGPGLKRDPQYPGGQPGGRHNLSPSAETRDMLQWGGWYPLSTSQLVSCLRWAWAEAWMSQDVERNITPILIDEESLQDCV